MTADERARMEYVCKRIAFEKDPVTFDQLVNELEELLEVKRQRMDPENQINAN